jgi:hypothetical protein
MATRVFTRKGGAQPPQTDDDNNDNGGDRPDDAHTDSDDAMVKCPECGCQFDPDDVKDAKPTPETADDDSPGAKVDIAAPVPDAQAPIGENAITAALAHVLGTR